MASFSLRTVSWDPYRVLDVYPDSTCVGFASSTGRRCRWPLHSEQFSASRRATAVQHLQSMAQMQPSQITLAALYSLARNTLCRDFHQNQADAVATEWQAKIDEYLHMHGVEDARQPPHEPDDAEKLSNGIAKDQGASQQAIVELCQALTRVTAQLQATETRCSELTTRNNTLGQQREEDRAALSREVENLKTQLGERNANFERDAATSSKVIEGLRKTLSQTETAKTLEVGSLKAEVRDRNKVLDEGARKSGAEADGLRRRLEASTREVASLQAANAEQADKARSSELAAEKARRGLRESDARYGALEAKSLTDAERLGQRIEELGRESDASKAEDARRISRLREQLAEREDQLSSLQLQNVKKGLFAVISRQPPRFMVRKISKIMRTESTPYVQSAA